MFCSLFFSTPTFADILVKNLFYWSLVSLMLLQEQDKWVEIFASIQSDLIRILFSNEKSGKSVYSNILFFIFLIIICYEIAVSQTPRSMPFCIWKGKGSFYSMIRNLMVSCSRLLRGVYTDQIYCWLCYFTWLSFLSQQYLPVGVLINPLAKPQLPLSRRLFSCKGRNHPLCQKSSENDFI